MCLKAIYLRLNAVVRKKEKASEKKMRLPQGFQGTREHGKQGWGHGTKSCASSYVLGNREHQDKKKVLLGKTRKSRASNMRHTEKNTAPKRAIIKLSVTTANFSRPSHRCLWAQLFSNNAKPWLNWKHDFFCFSLFPWHKQTDKPTRMFQPSVTKTTAGRNCLLEINAWHGFGCFSATAKPCLRLEHSQNTRCKAYYMNNGWKAIYVFQKAVGKYLPTRFENNGII